MSLLVLCVFVCARARGPRKACVHKGALWVRIRFNWEKKKSPSIFVYTLASVTSSITVLPMKANVYLRQSTRCLPRTRILRIGLGQPLHDFTPDKRNFLLVLLSFTSHTYTENMDWKVFLSLWSLQQFVTVNFLNFILILIVLISILGSGI